MKPLKITCHTKDTLSIDDMQELQGKLKNRKQKDIDKIKKSISKHGFATPFFI